MSTRLAHRVEYFQRVGDERLLRGRPLALAVAAIVHEQERACTVLGGPRRPSGDLLGVAAVVDQQRGGSARGLQEHPGEARAVVRREAQRFGGPVLRRGGLSHHGHRKEKQPLLQPPQDDAQPEPARDGDEREGLEQVQRGRSECPIRNASTSRAAWRPSRMAHTTSDCPRRMSPAANTFGTRRAVAAIALGGGAHVAALVARDAELLHQARLDRVHEAHREQHQVRRHRRTRCPALRIAIAPLLVLHPLDAARGELLHLAVARR